MATPARMSVPGAAANQAHRAEQAQAPRGEGRTADARAAHAIEFHRRGPTQLRVADAARAVPGPLARQIRQLRGPRPSRAGDEYHPSPRGRNPMVKRALRVSPSEWRETFGS